MRCLCFALCCLLAMISSANAEIVNLLCNVQSDLPTGPHNIIIDTDNKTVKDRLLTILDTKEVDLGKILDLPEFKLFQDGADAKD